ncbi:MAG: ROK family protein [Rhodomicrobium sp.]
MTGWRLVSDVGGTNVRFARAEAGKGLQKRSSYRVSTFATFSDALRTYLDETGGKNGCIGAAIGAAGRIASGAVRLTNLAWHVSESDVSSELGAPCTLINDVQAVSFSLPALSPADFLTLGLPEPAFAAARRLLVANIGTGFGAATLIRTSSGWTSCPSEAGHMSLTFSGWGDDSLRQKFMSVEHALSGHGLCNLHAAIANDTPALAPSEIIAKANSDPRYATTLRLFTQIAGAVLGNLVLAVAAWDGVLLCGSVARGFAPAADLSLLRQSFEGTGRMSEWKKQIPLALVTNDDAALIGLAVLPLGGCY